ASVNLVVKKGDGTVSAVKQGALEDSWLVSAFDILLPSEVLLRKVIVSDRHRDKGLYTLKLFKEGSWRYLHVDDCLPCWPLGDPYYCSCKDPNQARQTTQRNMFVLLGGGGSSQSEAATQHNKQRCLVWSQKSNE
ncbi:unnamed protein product, partial [Ascophyllum nodosum]